MISLLEGEKLVKLARESIMLKFLKKKPDLEKYCGFETPKGAFVTLHKNGELRGCVGFPLPVYPLKEAIVKASLAAAFSDTRFAPLEKDECNDIQVEISVLSVPKKIEAKKPEDYLKEINLGKDGLIVKNSYTSGLLLPQVASEWGWSRLEFLEATCQKAGLYKDAWKEAGTEVYKFCAQIFCEENGKVVEKND